MIFSLILLICVIIYVIYERVITGKVNKNKIKKCILYIIVATFITIVGIYIYSNITYSTNFSRNWDSIKDDFYVVNELAIEYFEKNEVNRIDVYEYKKILTSEQREVFERASKNYSKYNDYKNGITKIENKDGIISYYDWEGNGYLERIVYSKLSKREIKKVLNKGERHYVIEALGNDWYNYSINN